MRHRGYLANRLLFEAFCLPYLIQIRRKFLCLSLLSRKLRTVKGSFWVFCFLINSLKPISQKAIHGSKNLVPFNLESWFGIPIWSEGWEIQHVPISVCQVSWNTLCLFSWYNQNVVKVWGCRNVKFLIAWVSPNSFSILLASLVPQIWLAVRSQDLGKKSEK